MKKSKSHKFKHSKQETSIKHEMPLEEVIRRILRVKPDEVKSKKK